MTEADIARVLGQRLATLGRTIIWPNDKTKIAPGQIVVDMVPATRTTPALAGGATLSSGYMQASVIADLGGFTTAATAIAQDIADLFPKALRLERLTITEAAEIQRGYPDPVFWRIPVRVRYTAT